MFFHAAGGRILGVWVSLALWASGNGARAGISLHAGADQIMAMITLMVCKGFLPS